MTPLVWFVAVGSACAQHADLDVNEEVDPIEISDAVADAEPVKTLQIASIAGPPTAVELEVHVDGVISEADLLLADLARIAASRAADQLGTTTPTSIASDSGGD